MHRWVKGQRTGGSRVQEHHREEERDGQVENMHMWVQGPRTGGSRVQEQVGPGSKNRWVQGPRTSLGRRAGRTGGKHAQVGPGFLKFLKEGGYSRDQ